MFKIGDFSRVSHVSIRMLRHYDKLGLLTPDTIDEESGYRYYLASQLRTVNKIQKLKAMGFSLAVIKEILASEDDIDEIKTHFTIREEELKEELINLKQQSSLLEDALVLLREDVVEMDYNVILKEVPERKVISTRAILGSYDQEGILWEKAFKEVGKQQVKMAKMPYGMAIFHDKEYKEADVDVEVQTAVEGDYTDTDEVIFKTAPAVKVASVTMNGSYEQMSAVSETIAKWIEKNNYELNGPMFNIYHVSPGQDPNPENWITEVCFPVK